MIRSLVRAVVDVIARAIAPAIAPVPYERIANGGFDTGNGWSIQALSWVIGSGVATSATDGGGINQTIALVNSGTPITITADVTNANDVVLTIRLLMDGAITEIVYADTPATGALSVSAAVSAEFNGIRFTCTKATGLVLDNVSLIA